jgi:hypothetical protein
MRKRYAARATQTAVTVHASGLLRRPLLAALMSIGFAPRAIAQPPKMSQAAAHYQPTPRGGLSCIGCTFFRQPRSCQVVEGGISPSGWCTLFDLPD